MLPIPFHFASQDMTEEVTGIIYYADKEQLVVVGASCSLYVLGHGADRGEWQALSKMKFATGTGEAAGSLQVGCRCAYDANACVCVALVQGCCGNRDPRTLLHIDMLLMPCSACNGCIQVCWATDHTLASASERDNVVRMYNFDTEDNYVLQVSTDRLRQTGLLPGSQ
jgi:intraflagellar transport protein 140